MQAMIPRLRPKPGGQGLNVIQGAEVPVSGRNPLVQYVAAEDIDADRWSSTSPATTE